MLIIFDLDDTLIDTTGSITFYKPKKALDEMIKQGLVIDHPLTAFDEIKQINFTSLSSSETIKKFLLKRGVFDPFFSTALAVLQEPLPEDLDVKPTTGALEALRELKKNHTLCLVTIGNFTLQEQKMKKAGIEPTLFSKLVATSLPNKKKYYQEMIKEFDVLHNHEVIVCGDRVPIDLIPAKELGL